MKQRMKTTLVAGAVAFALIFTAQASHAQCKEVTWPTDAEMRAKAEEKKVLYEDAHRAGQDKQAAAPLNWLLINAPKLHTSLYIYGAEVYEKLANDEKDPARKKVYVDSLMIVYDMRIQNCGEEASVTNRKALSFAKYNLQSDPAKTLELFDKALELNGNNIMDGTIVPYFQVVRVNQLKLKNLTEENILERYDKIIAVIDAKIKKAQSEGKPIDRYKKMQDDIAAMLPTIITVDCKFVKTYLEPKFRQNPNDLGLAKKIFTFMLNDKCTDDPLWLEAGEAIHKLTPEAERDCGLAKNLGIKYLAKENFAKAEELLKEAQKVCTDNENKAEVLLYLGSIEARNGSKSQARELYRQAASLSAEVAKEAYSKIGNLYYNSFDECAKKVNMADDRLVFLIAADYYQRAGDSQGVARAKASFPSKEEIFLVNYKVGDSKTVGCWINENTTIRTRD